MALFRPTGLSFVVVLSALPACGQDPATTTEASTSSADTTDAPATTATTADVPATGTTTTNEPTTGDETSSTGTTGGEPQQLVPVAHTRELRAVWVATVSNINFPSATGLSAAALQDELLAILDTVQAAGLNTVVFQVRPECDAVYSSDLEPWSRYLTGEQGEDPGVDPLQFLIDEGHARGIEVHAWLNPYRAKANANHALADNHVASLLPQYAYEYSTFLWMDPGAKEVQDLLLAVVADLVTRYDVDGIHFDDYFYPYPVDGVDFPDDTTWEAYQGGGGQLSRADWRRDNVNAMVQAVGDTVADIAPHVRYGISPFGIYRPGIPEGINGFDQYEGLYADPLLWMQEGWVDYLAPQLYWPTTQAAQAYGKLIEWWSSITGGGRYIFAGNYLSKLGTEDKWSLDEFKQEILLSRQYAEQGSQGNIFFQIAPLQDNLLGVTDALRAEFYATPALTPPIAALVDEVPAPPTVTLEGSQATLAHADADSLRAWVVYAQSGQEFMIDRIVPAQATSIDLSPGTWAISAAGKHNVESAGVLVTVP
ncbi:family 10 glycosylhydrolase [Nannocystis sp. RBIL2]|uniref:glycoside hydrolase family 10 protein n=1 Tax=Nannocystis sp. RBIL2 TaxID=2996788 RepID=UPI0022710201|nr:family 10 glycosylhydrolase [Nannocystis sp. RBIL2]MCY1065744.1 family 10 glycosylhydrolase [Nannocystis sp. RBIL2]